MDAEEEPGGRRVEDLVLDAARDCVLAYGVRRTTVTDVARRAGVSRMSVYRRWPDVQSLVADLMSREWHRVIVDAARQAAAADGPLRARLVTQSVTAAATLRVHPLLRKILEVDPEILLPYMLDRRGAGQEEMLGFLVEMIAAGQAEGSVRGGDPARLARAVLLTAQSFVLSVATVTDGHTPSDLDDELTLLLDRYLSPLPPAAPPRPS
ncbi:TetR/AcrR family transcriptional regulator [Catellatospora coxensis]|uniref:TetR family transcriptional regulator n=1 Tax=Catellatospora coxensis TaxID=310354 RepID=A0A8J3L2L3_9ACTN|nr:TetR/AcrR family transcriptional regulator [Catellatospora coxensis]GIG07869.1 TetR family transcriptional regulator [Catellatospora coxensis]